jgi:hypothetical protein
VRRRSGHDQRVDRALPIGIERIHAGPGAAPVRPGEDDRAGRGFRAENTTLVFQGPGKP